MSLELLDRIAAPTEYSCGFTGETLVRELMLKSIILEEDWESLPAETRAEMCRETNRDRLQAQLVQQQLLTEFQANRIRAGQMGGLILGNYRVLERVGAGGMGVVFKAEHIIMRRLAAIKVVPVSFHQEHPLLMRFVAEMRAVAKLQHPNIVEAFEAGRTGGSDCEFSNLYYFVMEFVPGMDLEQYVLDHGPLPPAKACDVTYQVACALVEAHRKKLVHRDIKPSNILLTGEGQVKLTDFGLALHFQQRQLTMPGTTLGTVDYMAPEQALDASTVDIRADIYSLGATLYWCLTGQLPFELGTSLAATLAARQKTGPPSPRLVRPDIPSELDALVMKCMALRPQDRFEDPHALMQGLLGFLRSESMHRELHLESPASPRHAMHSAELHNGSRKAARVLIVDDEPSIRSFVRIAYSDEGYECEDAENGTQALALLSERPFDLVYMDLAMPKLDGAETLARIRANPPHPNIKVIMTSGKIAPDQMAQFLASGADDFLPKPTSLEQLRARTKAVLKLKDAQDRSDRLTQRLQAVNCELARNLTDKEFDLIQARNNLILALADLASLRVGAPDGHPVRMQRYCRTLADQAAQMQIYANEVDLPFIAMLECCAPLHNIGQVALPDHVLQKPGKLDVDERRLMETHPTLGADMLERVFERNPSALVFVQTAIEIVRHHHERFDGTGYPDKLAGADIPLSARFVAIADVYDALRSRRLHRPALSHSVAVEIISSSKGQFDPALLTAFAACADRFEQIFRECV